MRSSRRPLRQTETRNRVSRFVREPPGTGIARRADIVDGLAMLIFFVLSLYFSYRDEIDFARTHTRDQTSELDVMDVNDVDA